MSTAIANAQSLMRDLARNWERGREIEGTEWRSRYSQTDVLLTRFDIAEALYFLDPNAIPAEWEFRIGAHGGWDYSTCVDNGDGEGCETHSGECDGARMMLEDLGVDLDDPFNTRFAMVSHGERAIDSLRYVGTVLFRYDRLLRLYYGDL